MEPKDISPEFIQNLFGDVHRDYCNHYDDFSKRIKTLVDKHTTETEANDIVDWALEYKNSLEMAKTALDDFEEQLKLGKMQLSRDRIYEKEIFDKVSNMFLPYAIVYATMLRNKKNV